VLCAFSKIAAPLARTPSGMSQGQRLEHRAPLAARPMPLNLMCVAQHDSCNGFMHDYLLSNRAPGQHMTAACGVMRHAKQTCTPPMHLTRSSWRVQGLPPQDPRADGGAAAARLHEVMRRLLGQCTDRRAQAAALCGWACMPWAVARSARRGGAARSPQGCSSVPGAPSQARGLYYEVAVHGGRQRHMRKPAHVHSGLPA